MLRQKTKSGGGGTDSMANMRAELTTQNETVPDTLYSSPGRHAHFFCLYATNTLSPPLAGRASSTCCRTSFNV